MIGKEYYVKCRNGGIKFYYNLEDLLWWLKHVVRTRIKITIARYNDYAYWKEESNLSRIGHNWNDNCDYIIYDKFGRVQHKTWLEKEVDKLPEKRYKYKYRSWRYLEENWLGFRNGPVPYTRKYRGGRSQQPRNIMQEIRRNYGDDLQFVRKSRKQVLRDLSDWDARDRNRWCRYQSWKKQKKKKQWM